MRWHGSTIGAVWLALWLGVASAAAQEITAQALEEGAAAVVDSSTTTVPDGRVQEETLHPPQPVKTPPVEAEPEATPPTAEQQESPTAAEDHAPAHAPAAEPEGARPSGADSAGADADAAAAQQPTAIAPTTESPAADAPVAGDSERPGADTEASPRSPLLFEGDYLPTVDRLRRALQLDPSSTDTRFALGQALFGLGDVDAALEAYKQVTQERPTSVPARLHLATAYMAKRRWKDAQKELTTILAQDSKVAAAHHSLGAVRYSQGDVRGAIDAYRAALALAPDSVETHYNLGVVLRLAGRWKEAIPELQAAAEAGHSKAQYFLASAYASGTGVDRDQALAIRWWMSAAEHGVTEAQDSLSRLRKIALKPNTAKDAAKTLKAFQTYRENLWFAFPELTPNGKDETVGIALLQAFRVREAVSALIHEATAMGELSERYLAALYEEGLQSLLAPNDPRIYRYFELAAGDGAPHAKLALARFHALGLGVPADRTKALAIIKGLPAGYAEQFLQDLASRPAGTAAARDADPPGPQGTQTAPPAPTTQPEPATQATPKSGARPRR